MGVAKTVDYSWLSFAKLSSSPVQVGTEISLKFDYYHPPTPGKVEMQLEIGNIWTVGSW